jgi:hypothetical protein
MAVDWGFSHRNHTPYLLDLGDHGKPRTEKLGHLIGFFIDRIAGLSLKSVV